MDDERHELREAHRKRAADKSALDAIGLTEVEALEYALMISRDEEDARRGLDAINTIGRISYSLDRGTNPSRTPASDQAHARPIPITIPLASYRRSPPLRSAASFGSGHHSNPDNTKVQVSPRLHGSSVSPSSPSALTKRSPGSVKDTHPQQMAGPRVSPTTPTFGVTPRTPPGSVWSRARPMSMITPPLHSPVLARPGGPSLLSDSLRQHEGPSPRVVADEDEGDEDLKLAIALSLAEAESRARQ